MLHQTLRTRSALSALMMGTAILTTPAFAQSNNDEDEIIVTGSIFTATTNENLVGVSVLTGEELQRRISSSLGETLKFEPGISSSFFGAGASRPIIRGQGGLRVLLLDNGVGSIDASSASPDHAGAIEPAMASRIEVIRGSGLLRYGSAASGGVINVIDGRIPDRVPENGFAGNARIGISSVDSGHEIALGSDINLGEFGDGEIVAHAEFSRRKAQDYDIPGFARSDRLRQQSPMPVASEERDTLVNSAAKATSFAGGISYISEDTFFGSAIKDLSSEYGIPGGEGARIILDQTRYDFTSKFDLDSDVFESLNFLGGAADYKHQEVEPSGEVGTVFTNNGFELRAEVTQNERGAWQAIHGIQYKKRKFSAIGEEAFVPPTTTNTVGAFSFHELEFDELHLEAAARYENIKHTEKSGKTTTFDGFSGSFGADYHLTDTTKLGGTIYRTKRAPTTEELFSNGPHLATNQFEIGDPSLGLETATGAEISLRYEGEDSHFTLNVFRTEYADYIFERATGANMITDEGDVLAVSKFTASDAVFKGFEVDAAKEIGNWNGMDMTIDASLEYVDANLKTTGQNALPRIPPFGLTLGMDVDGERWGVRTELEYAVKKTELAIGELPSDGYVLINAFANFDVTDAVTLQLSALNLSNQDARQHTSYLKEVVPLPGRNFKLSMSVAF